MANSDLIGRKWKIPDQYLTFLREKLTAYKGNKHVEGYTRLNNLLTAGEISYENLKNVKHILDKNKNDETLYNLNGGKEFHIWIENQLKTARNGLESAKKIQKDVGVQNAYKKPHEKDSTNKGKVRTPKMHKSLSSKDIFNNNVNYESVVRPSIKVLVTENQYRQLFMENNYGIGIDDKVANFLKTNPHWDGFQNVPNLELIDNNDVTKLPYSFCQANKCETNAFEYVKNSPKFSELVVGFMVTSGGTPIEHYWVYDNLHDYHMDITPLGNFKPAFYIGLRMPQITDNIVNAKQVWDIYELKGGNVFFKYFKPYFKDKDKD